MRCLRGLILRILTVLFLLSPTLSAHADEKPDGRSGVVSAKTPVEAVYAAINQGDGGMGVLASSGAQVRRLTGLERLPDREHYAAEIHVDLKERALLLPLVLRRTTEPDGWALAWQPNKDYVEALFAMLESGRLPKSRHAPRWEESPRLISFPVIVTAKRLVTPMGVVSLVSTNDDDFREHSHGLREIKPLHRQAQQWIDKVLLSDPAPASFDLIVDEQVSWKLIADVSFSLAYRGLFRIFVVTDSGNATGALSLVAPVGSFMLVEPPPISVNVNWVEGQPVGRLMHPNLVVPKLCEQDPKAWLCPESSGELLTALRSLVDTSEGPFQPRVVFSTVGETPVSYAFSFVDELIHTMQIAPHKLVIIFARRAANRRAK